MIRNGFLSAAERKELVSLARDGSAEHRFSRRAKAILLLDDGLSCERVAKVLYLDDDTVRSWHKLYDERGISGLEQFDSGGSASRLSTAQEDALKAHVAQVLPRSTREIGAFIAREFGVVYESRAGLIALLHRLGLEYHKPEVIGRKLTTEKQHAFIAAYEDLLNSLGPDETVVFGDAVHPTHAARPVGCWAPKDDKLAIEQTSGRERLNIHGALDLETGQTRMIDAETINANSTIRLLEALEAAYPLLTMIHLISLVEISKHFDVFLDNAKYHHAKLVQAWLAQPECRIKLHFVPAYCPHLNPIERLWGVMHKNVTHNKCYANSREFAQALLGFLRVKVPQNWAEFSDTITDNFRVINPKDFRVVA